MKNLLNISPEVEKTLLSNIGNKPFLIVGGTASGKSITANHLNKEYGGVLFDDMDHSSNELRTDYEISKYLDSGNVIAETHSQFAMINQKKLEGVIMLKCKKEGDLFSVSLAS
jgi:adenylate kinase family enzyme